MQSSVGHTDIEVEVSKSERMEIVGLQVYLEGVGVEMRMLEVEEF